MKTSEQTKTGKGSLVSCTDAKI